LDDYLVTLTSLGYGGVGGALGPAYFTFGYFYLNITTIFSIFRHLLGLQIKVKNRQISNQTMFKIFRYKQRVIFGLDFLELFFKKLFIIGNFLHCNSIRGLHHKMCFFKACYIHLALNLPKISMFLFQF
jgi:hypothetical protein